MNNHGPRLVGAVMTTETIEALHVRTGFPLLDALLGGGLRAGTLTAVLSEDCVACCAAASELHSAIIARTPLVDWYGSQGSPDPAAVKRSAMDRGRAAVIYDVWGGGRDRHDVLRHAADVVLCITGKAYQMRVDVTKHRGGNTGSFVFTYIDGVLKECGVCLWDEPRPLDPAVATERGRWVEEMALAVASLRARADGCHSPFDASRPVSDAIIAGRDAYAHAASLVSDAIARAQGTP